MSVGWEDITLSVCKDDQYKGDGHKCISYKGVIYYSVEETDRQKDEVRKAKQLIAAMAGLLVDGREQELDFGSLLSHVFRSRANEAVCGGRIAGLLADIIDRRNS